MGNPLGRTAKSAVSHADQVVSWRMPRRSTCSVARHMPRLAAACLVARLVQSCGTCLAWSAHASWLGCLTLAAVLEAGHQPKHHGRRSAQPAAVADAAARPQDRRHFEGWNRVKVISIYRCGAAKRQSVGAHKQSISFVGSVFLSFRSFLADKLCYNRNISIPSSV